MTYRTDNKIRKYVKGYDLCLLLKILEISMEKR